MFNETKIKSENKECMSFKKSWEKLSEEEIQGGCELKKPVGKKVKKRHYRV